MPLDIFSNLLAPFGGSSVLDGAKLVLVGSGIETARRMSSSAWSHFVNSFYLTAHFSEEDYPFSWLHYWLMKQPAWGRSREFETTTRTVSSTGAGSGKPNAVGGDEFQDFQDEDDQEDELTPGKQRMKVVFMPTFDSTHTIYYKQHWLRVRRWRKQDTTEMLSISVVARNNSILKQLVLQAKKEYEADAEHRVNIYFADSHGSWRWTDSRQKRPMSSIVLNPGVKEMLLSDTRDFLKSEKWYADRGIPFRRGYLLYGVPGSGKTSLIHSIAGELALDIYVVSLSSSWINDSTLTTLMGRVPARCILLLEDLDAAFTRSATRDDESTGAPTSTKEKDAATPAEPEASSSHHRSSRRHHSSTYTENVNTLSLSGLLNSLDGVAAAEGRILFATTNHLERLDPALSRPGRMDVWIEFKNASKWQAEHLFKNFFPSADDIPPPTMTPPTEEEELAALAATANTSPLAPSGSGESSKPWSRPTPSPSPSMSSSMSSSSDSSVSTATTSESEATQTEAETETDSPPQSPVSTTSEIKPVEGLSEKDQILHDPGHSAPPLDSVQLAQLAQKFADSIPNEEFSVASLQGYLLKNKSRPVAAAEGAAAWVISERELRIRLKKEKEEREAKEAKEKEKRKKDREEKEKKEKEEKEEKEKEEKEAAKKKEEREKRRKERAKKAAEVKEDEEDKKEEEEAAKIAEKKKETKEEKEKPAVEEKKEEKEEKAATKDADDSSDSESDDGDSEEVKESAVLV